MNWLVNLFSGGLFDKVTDGLLKAQQQYLNAKNDTEKLVAEQNIQYWQNRVAVAQAAAQSDKFWSVRSIMGYTVALYVFKLIVWDTVLGWGVTPDPGPVIGTIVSVIIGFYFLSKPMEKVADALSARWIAKR